MDEIQAHANTAEICKLAGIESPTADVTPREHLKRLIAASLLPEAVRFLANAMEPLHAVEWACASVKRLQPEQVTNESRAALCAAETWLRSREDSDRRAAKECAERAGFETPEGCLSMAAFLSAGSIAPSTAPHVDAPPNVGQKLAAAAVTLAVVQQPARAAERFRSVLDGGAGRLSGPA